MTPAIIQKIIHQYGYQPQRILSPQKGYRNQSWPILLLDGTMVNLIAYKREPDILQTIHNANTVSAFLAARKLPVRQLADPRIMGIGAGDHRQYVALYNYLPGTTIPWEAYTRRHIVLLGSALGNMHTQSKNFAVELPRVTTLYSKIIGRMQGYFAQPPVRRAMRSKLGFTIADYHLAYMSRLMRACALLPEQQVLHMDFVRGNILFGRTPELTITGILDFEKTAYGPPLFDLARTLAFLLVDCKTLSEPRTRKYFLRSGYIKRSASRVANPPVTYCGQTVRLLEALVDMFLLYDMYKFLRHNPYEFLNQNEHFIRTRGLLARRGLLQQDHLPDHLSMVL